MISLFFYQDYMTYQPFSKLKEHIKAGTCPALYENEKGEVQSFLETEPPIITKQPLDGYRQDKQKEMEFMYETDGFRYLVEYKYTTSTIGKYNDVLEILITHIDNVDISTQKFYANSIVIYHYVFFTKSKNIPSGKQSIYNSYFENLKKKLEKCS